jgi:catechol 2,3-dioxygenase-like lactoylglutathione lyase family enzyme
MSPRSRTSGIIDDPHGASWCASRDGAACSYPQGMEQSVAHAVIYVLDPARTSKFYVEVCGLQPTERADERDLEFATLTSDAWHLTLVRVPDEVADEIGLDGLDVRRTETPIKLSFSVPDLDRARHIAASVGGIVDSVDAEWEWGEWRICDGQDPEGNVVQLRTPFP